jgi:DNA ligase D
MKNSDLSILAGGHTVTVSHPDKILYPEAGISKRDLINYYLETEKVILSHNRGRPVVYVRYPHGQGQYAFFQKNVPENHPAWLKIKEMGKHKPTRYLILDSIADLIWLVQLHALEFHIINVREPFFDHPDLMVFDIDPPAGYSFSGIVETAFLLKEILEKNGYHPYAKTSGKRGIHVVCPVKSEFSVEQIFQAAEDIARQSIRKNPAKYTLDVRKNLRQNKFLIDIYRNRAFQTFSMPYGSRATPDACVSMPVKWETLEKLDSPGKFTVKTVPAYLKKHGDAWEDMPLHSTGLHI